MTGCHLFLSSRRLDTRADNRAILIGEDQPLDTALYNIAITAQQSAARAEAEAARLRSGMVKVLVAMIHLHSVVRKLDANGSQIDGLESALEAITDAVDALGGGQGGERPTDE